MTALFARPREHRCVHRVTDVGLGDVQAVAVDELDLHCTVVERCRERGSVRLATLDGLPAVSHRRVHALIGPMPGEPSQQVVVVDEVLAIGVTWIGTAVASCRRCRVHRTPPA